MDTSKRNICRLAFVALALFVAAFPSIARPQQPAPKPVGNLYVTTFIDVLPDYTAATTALVQQYYAASKHDSGLVSFEALRQDGRENHMTLVVVWKTKEDFAKHEAEFDTKMFREKLLPYLGAPYDERLNWVIPGTSAPIISLKPIDSHGSGPK
jgi:quinol monooxygenase YgiN